MDTPRHGFPGAAHDNDSGKVEALLKESAEHDIHSAANIEESIGLKVRDSGVRDIKVALLA
jgi:hypothetical protein